MRSWCSFLAAVRLFRADVRGGLVARPDHGHPAADDAGHDVAPADAVHLADEDADADRALAPGTDGFDASFAGAGGE